MDYEKKYNEAIERMRKMLGPWRELAYNGKSFLQDLESIFPELRESEDERIRQYLIEWVSISDNPRKKECLSWLEKQKEQKPIGTDFCTAVKNLMNLHKIKNEFTEEDYDFQAKELLKLIKQKPAEWSEEDSIMLDSILAVIEEWESNQSEKEKEYYGATPKADWLKSLRPQPKQEWSEEDKKVYSRLLNHYESLTHCVTTADRHKEIREELNFLKSLRPSWKPSEEQMNCLCAAVDAAIRKHNESVGGYKPARVLKSLYEDLQKL